MDYMNLIVMVLVGALSGTLAAQIMKGDSMGFVVNAILGIGGAVVGGFLFNLLGLTPGAGTVKVISETFGVELPQNFVGMIISSTIGAIIILWAFRILGAKRRR